MSGTDEGRRHSGCPSSHKGNQNPETWPCTGSGKGRRKGGGGRREEERGRREKGGGGGGGEVGREGSVEKRVGLRRE